MILLISLIAFRWPWKHDWTSLSLSWSLWIWEVFSFTENHFMQKLPSLFFSAKNISLPKGIHKKQTCIIHITQEQSKAKLWLPSNIQLYMSILFSLLITVSDCMLMPTQRGHHSLNWIYSAIHSTSFQMCLWFYFILY